MFCSNLLRSWAHSINLAKPTNFIPLVKQATDHFCTAYKELISRYWWVLLVDFFIAMIALQQDILLDKKNIYTTGMYMVIIIIFTLLMRKTASHMGSNKEFMRDFWHSIAWYVAYFCMLIGLIASIFLIIVPIMWIVSVMQGFTNTSSQWLYFYVPLMIQSLGTFFGFTFLFSNNFMLFYWLDSDRSFKNLWYSAKNGLHLLFHYLPLFLATLFVLWGTLWILGLIMLQCGFNPKISLIQNINVRFLNMSDALFFMIFMIIRHLKFVIAFLTISLLFSFYQKETRQPLL